MGTARRVGPEELSSPSSAGSKGSAATTYGAAAVRLVCLCWLALWTGSCSGLRHVCGIWSVSCGSW